MPNTPISFEPVEVTRASTLGFFCLVQGEEIFVGQNVPLEGTTVRLKGDRGRLVLPRWFASAQRLRLPPP